MKYALFLSLFLLTNFPAASQSAPEAVTDNTVVLKSGDIALTKAQYEKLVVGFDRSSGATATGATPQSKTSGQDVAKLLALVSAAKERKIDQDPVTAAQMQVRGYVLLANTLLVRLRDEMKKDEAGTRDLWASDANGFVELRVQQILIRFRDAKLTKPGQKGLTRTEAEAKALAESLRAKLAKGADFATVAKESSEDEATSARGGELPPFTRGSMTSEFETAAFGLAPGALSEPFKSDYGYHVIKVIEHRRIPFERVRAALEDIRARALYEQLGKAGIQLNEEYFKK